MGLVSSVEFAARELVEQTFEKPAVLRELQLNHTYVMLLLSLRSFIYTTHTSTFILPFVSPLICQHHRSPV